MTLWGFERRWASEVSRAFVGADALGGATAGADPGALFADDCATVPWISAAPIRLALWLVWWAPFPRTFGSLSAERREELLERMLHSQVALVRMLVMFLKLICVSLVLGDAGVLRQLGAYGQRT